MRSASPRGATPWFERGLVPPTAEERRDLARVLGTSEATLFRPVVYDVGAPTRGCCPWASGTSARRGHEGGGDHDHRLTSRAVQESVAGNEEGRRS